MGRIKLDKTSINVRVDWFTCDWFRAEAEKEGFVFAGQGQTGAFLDAIALGKYKIVKNEDVVNE